MSTWTGWQADFLQFAQVPNTAGNRKFLTDWNEHAETNCGNNPIDLSAPVSGSTNCHALPGIIPKAQHYTTHGNAGHAFFVQTHAGYATALLSALRNGSPYTVNNTGKVAESLAAWGSQTFSQWYFQATANAPGRGAGGDVPRAPRVHTGWHDLRRAVNHNGPAALAASDRSVRKALRSLHRARRVGR